MIDNVQLSLQETSSFSERNQAVCPPAQAKKMKIDRMISPIIQNEHKEGNTMTIKTNFNLPNEDSRDQSNKSPSHYKWKKVFKVFKSISLLKQHEIKSLENEIDFAIDLQDYQERLFINTKNSNNESTNKNNNNDELKQTIHEALTKVNTNKSRDSLKMEVYHLIIEGENDCEDRIRTILNYNPDKNIRSPSDPLNLFNTALLGGQNLLYVACKEGKEKIVSLFLSNGFNARLTSQIDKDTWENPLECACRWNYIKVVKLLLNEGNYTFNEIKKAMKLKNLNKSIKKLLVEAIKKLEKETLSCFC